jgi:hypothetical protein
MRFDNGHALLNSDTSCRQACSLSSHPLPLVSAQLFNVNLVVAALIVGFSFPVIGIDPAQLFSFPFGLRHSDLSARVAQFAPAGRGKEGTFTVWSMAGSFT